MSLASLDLNLLKVLDALFREGSTTRAGQRVGLSQPAVSAALGRLRHALGDDLFVRRGQGLVPTDYARTIEAPLREILHGIEGPLTARADWRPDTATETIRLSGIDIWGEMLLPALVRRLAEDAPGMTVQLVDLVPDATADLLEAHEIDIALLPDFDPPAWCSSAPLFDARFVVIARTGHPRLARAGLSPGDTVPLDLFCDLDHVLLSPDGKMQALGDAALAAVGRSRRIRVTVPFFSAVARLVEETDAIALTPVQAAREFAARGRIETFEPPMKIDRRRLVMLWHRRFDDAPAHRWVRERIGEICHGLSG